MTAAHASTPPGPGPQPGPVSRETRPVALRPALGDAALELVGPALDALDRYVAVLAGAGVERGLLGPKEASRLWDRHILNCAVVAPLIPAGASLADVGSGAGLPGIVLALVRPDLEVTLVEPLLRRATFLTEVVDDLAIVNAQVVRARAEDRARQVASGDGAPVDVVTARAVAPLDRLSAWCLPLLKDRGQLLAIKGAGAADEVRAAEAMLRGSGARSVDLLEVGAGVVDPPTRVVRVVAGPRRTGARRRD